MVRFLAASPSFSVCVSVCTGELVLNHTPQMLCVDMCVRSVCLLFQSLWEVDVQNYTLYVVQTKPFYKSKTFVKYIRNLSIIQSRTLTTSSPASPGWRDPVRMEPLGLIYSTRPEINSHLCFGNLRGAHTALTPHEWIFILSLSILHPQTGNADISKNLNTLRLAQGQRLTCRRCVGDPITRSQMETDKLQHVCRIHRFGKDIHPHPPTPTPEAWLYKTGSWSHTKQGMKRAMWRCSK